MTSKSSEDDATTLTRMNFSGYAVRLRNDLYCVEWGVKLYSLILDTQDMWLYLELPLGLDLVSGWLVVM